MSQNRSPSSVNNEALSQVQIPVQAVIIGLAVVGGLIGVVGGTPRYISATLPVALLVLLLAAAAWLLAG
ncbi:MAG: hypothetical protein WBO46_01165, partial [Caldilineaceae bacterium]